MIVHFLNSITYAKYVFYMFGGFSKKYNFLLVTLLEKWAMMFPESLTSAVSNPRRASYSKLPPPRMQLFFNRKTLSCILFNPKNILKAYFLYMISSRKWTIIFLPKLDKNSIPNIIKSIKKHQNFCVFDRFDDVWYKVFI